ncbi:MAG: mannose-phosphate guanyltransferase [Gammaproteobacteria bacterium]|jgi:mannose-1-phosphate guanylyltransferase/mannose-6-phosphate isomerase|nr:mannose-phosphate guanyltransferase [Gammaproteobacteria bacterium]
MIVPVILAGGSGSRLWPLSRSAYPKQLLALVGSRTLLQDTVLRTQAIPHMAPPILICNQEHRFLVAEQLKQIGMTNAVIILEPVGKNTAPAAAIAALYLKQKMVNPTLLILPADHIIKDVAPFVSAMHHAERNAQAGRLVTFGIVPSRPETGYGYIKSAIYANEEQGYKVLEFVEKPDYTTANAYLASGQYYWNSGMFMFQATVYLEELARYAPDIFHTCQEAVKGMMQDLDFLRLNQEIFAACPNNSIDYTVMEKTQNAVLVNLNAEWNDMGSWSALCEMMEADQDGNVMQGDVMAQQVRNSYLRAESRMLAVIGLDNHIVVETSDVVLVAHKDHCQNVKEMVNSLRQKQRPEIDLHFRVYRPWGYYEMIDKNACFQVKHITVKPGASLSLQQHHYRSEHWVVVRGIAEVTRGEEIFTIKANESTYIPQGVKHRLANPYGEDLEIIEVQSGSYLGEDDIVRFDDEYGRVASL